MQLWITSFWIMESCSAVYDYKRLRQTDPSIVRVSKLVNGILEVYVE